LNRLIRERSAEFDQLRNRPAEIRYVDKDVIQYVDEVVEDKERIN